MAISRESLLTLEAYEKARPEMRKQAIAHKKARKVFIGDNVLLQFEDETTIRYQIQEMLRAEKTFDQSGIQEELDAYNPLVPDGRNWKATQMIEYTDVDVRKQKLTELKGIERHTYVQIGEHDRVYAIADEDIPRENEEKTSAVHFMRFELGEKMIESLRSGCALAIGIDLPAYSFHVDDLSAETKASLLQDLARSH